MRSPFVLTAVALTATALFAAAAPAIAHAPPAASAAPAHAAAAAGYCGYYDGSRTTRRGDRGNAVQEIQCLINIWSGGSPLAVDGDFGPRTESWVVHFQDVNGLRVDGVVGPQTWSALRAL
jgi:peptidoglycan hydrolase-like protein with peptidoglycan-binding domain